MSNCDYCVYKESEKCHEMAMSGVECYQKNYSVEEALNYADEILEDIHSIYDKMIKLSDMIEWLKKKEAMKL